MELVRQVQKFMTKMGEPEQFQGRIVFTSMFDDIIWRTIYNEKECIANSTFVSLFAKRFPSGIQIATKDHKENGTESLNS